MAHSIRGYIDEKIDDFKKRILQFKGLPFNDLLPAAVIADFVEHTPHKRASVFSPLVTLKAFIFQVLSDDSSCRNAVASVLADRLGDGKTANTINTGPYCKARQRLPLEQLIEAVKSVGSCLHRQMPDAWRWKGYNVVLADGTTVLMPDTLKNQAAFPQQSNQKPGLGFPIARMVALISLAAGTVMAYSMGTYQGKGTGETSLLSQLFGSLSVGDLLLADRYYCTFGIIALLHSRGIPVLFPIHANKKVNFRQGVILGEKDHLTEWKKPKRKPVWMSDQDYAALPETVTVREFSVDGAVYVTTLLDPIRFEKHELALLYKERWNVELDFRSIKTDMGMEMLRCESPDMVQKEVAVHLLSYNLIRGNLAQAAYLNEKFPRELSFRSAVQLVTQTAGMLVNLAGAKLIKALHELLKAVASTVIGKQKRKSQPRAVKRRPKPFPLLTVPRNEACLNIGF